MCGLLLRELWRAPPTLAASQLIDPRPDRLIAGERIIAVFYFRVSVFMPTRRASARESNYVLFDREGNRPRGDKNYGHARALLTDASNYVAQTNETRDAHPNIGIMNI